MAEAQPPVRIATLGWGVKQSFRNYVEATGGTIETLGGAERASDGGFIFPATAGEGVRLDADGRPQGRAAFQGGVRFEAHGGMLSVRLADPAVELGPTGGALSVADAAAGGRRVEIARLDVPAMAWGDDGEIVIPAALTIDGCFLLGDHYPPMTPLDPVRLALAGR